MAQNLVGRTLGRTYRLERLLGTGSVGSVYVARHVRTGGLCAVRVVPRALVGGADVFARFQEETRLVTTLRHPYILATTDVDWDEDQDLYVVTDLVEGESLAQRLRQVGSLPLSQALDLARQVGSALHAAHRLGVLHRDLRPESIFLCRSDLFMGADRVVEAARVGDFGMALLRRSDGEGGMYVAPEVLQGARPDGRTDEWALGAVLYRALAGHGPLDEGGGAAPLHQLAPEVPAHVAAAIGRALAERREERFDTVLDLIRALEGRSAPTVISGIPSTIPPSAQSPVALGMILPREAPRIGRRWMPVLAGLCAVLLSTSVAGLVVRLPGKRHPAQVTRGSAATMTAAVPAMSKQVRPAPLAPTQRPAAQMQQSAVQEAPAAPVQQVAAQAEAKRSAAEIRHSPISGPGISGIWPVSGAARTPRQEPTSEQLLRQAQDLYASGARERALSLGVQAAELRGPNETAVWRFVGSAACGQHELRLAGRAFRHLAAEDRDFLISLCRSWGIAYAEGKFHQPAGLNP